MTRIAFKNLGPVVSGDVDQPLLDIDTLLVADGRIHALGSAAADQPADLVVDVRGATLTPGLWDAHYHPFFGEYTPRAEGLSTVSRAVRAGVTSFVSAGPAHQPGMYLPTATLPNVQALSQQSAAALRPEVARDALGTKALAIVSTLAWHAHRPLGAHVYAETVIAEPGLQLADFRELAAAGVRRIKFLRPIPSVDEGVQYARWARDVGLQVLVHTGGRKLLGGAASIGEALRLLHPDVACHVNGGPTPPPREDVDWLIDHTDAALDLVINGNLRIAAYAIQRLAERDELRRLVLGTDSPSASGIQPWGIVKFVTLLAQVTQVEPEKLLCLASGSTATAFKLPGGHIRAGDPADLVVWDPIQGSVTDTTFECLSYGDMIVPGLVMIDGEIKLHGDPRMIDPKRMPALT